MTTCASCSPATSSPPNSGKQVIRTAHQCGIRSTSTLMYGHVETPTHWVNQLVLLRDIQQQTGGFTEFVPLGFVHQNTLAVSAGNRAPRPHPGRASQDSRPGADHAGGRHQQYSGVVGKAEPAPVATLPARRRQRLRRNIDGRKHLARSRSHGGTIHQRAKNSSR